MPLPNLVSNILAGRSKRSLTMIAVTMAVIFGALFAIAQVRPLAETKLAAFLKDAGFPRVEIGELSLYPHGLRASNITLDQYGFDKIGTLDAAFSWPSFLTAGKISNVEIKDVNLTRGSDDLTRTAQTLSNKLFNLPDHRIVITNAVIDLDTGFGGIRVIIDATTEPTATGEHRVQSSIRAEQYQLGFSSTWQGTLGKNGTLDLAGTVLDGRLNIGPLRLSRFNGWIGATINADGHTIQSQLQVGSASFMGVPLQNVSLVNDSSAKQDDVIVRSGISGMPDVVFTADMKRKDKEQSFTAILKGKNLGGLLDHVDEVTKADKKIGEALLNLRAFEMTATLQPEKRFVGGPLPFALSLNAGTQSVLDGNILIYPDSFDIRGSLETSSALTPALQSYFKIPSKNIVQNYIRLDGDARNFLGFGESPSAPE